VNRKIDFMSYTRNSALVVPCLRNISHGWSNNTRKAKGAILGAEAGHPDCFNDFSHLLKKLLGYSKSVSVVSFHTSQFIIRRYAGLPVQLRIGSEMI
jgi:hypothetical protein